ncbi:PEP-CTERM sorting domain-containing protein [Roseateles koreensis]|uniref:PEP-CTERM sorting domain-containing protein n=1 Tax=Roseateles koreensis TaxID=2987526 RepID=A0ABT5KMB2_9BURK|nr:PEP-CTERM sorting domain-containing protein [Roseateles koreensis]MDC8784049.1 PEP-CTERM sorting domain-containing protein [Roseateles koreensis]
MIKKRAQSPGGAAWALFDFLFCARKGLGQIGFLSLSVAAGGSALAAISPGVGTNSTNLYNSNGELALSVFDATAQVSYTLDLGLDINHFFVAAQQEIGVHQYIPISDAAWTDFLTNHNVDASNLRWMVFGMKQTGSTGSTGGVPGDGKFFGVGPRLFTTIQQGDEGNVASLKNSLLGNALNQAGNFYTQVNVTGTQGSGVADYTVNGSSVNALSDSTVNAYDGTGGKSMTPTLNGNAPFDISNKVGVSSWFYYLSSSGGSNANNTIVTDKMDNLSANGYWGFTKVPSDANSIYAGQYLLSYTLNSSLPVATSAAGMQRLSFTDFAAGFSTSFYVPAVAEFANYKPSSLVVGTLLASSLAATVTAVPEPSSWALMGLGLAAMGWRVRRRA